MHWGVVEDFLLLGKEGKYVFSFEKPSVVWLTGYTGLISQPF